MLALLRSKRDRFATCRLREIPANVYTLYHTSITRISPEGHRSITYISSETWTQPDHSGCGHGYNGLATTYGVQVIAEIKGIPMRKPVRKSESESQQAQVAGEVRAAVVRLRCGALQRTATGSLDRYGVCIASGGKVGHKELAPS